MPAFQKPFRAWLLAAALALSGVQAQAEGLPCGVYRNQLDAKDALVVDSANSARHLRHDMQPVAMHYVATGGAWTFYGLPAGYQTDDVYEFSASPPALRPKRKPMFSDGHPTFKLTEPAKCAAPAEVPPNGCRADLAVCNKQVFDVDETTLGPWCRTERVAFACDALIRHYELAAEGKAKPKTPANGEEPVPDVCKKGEPSFVAAKCEELMMRKLREAMPALARDVANDMARSVGPVLPADRLDEIAKYCAPGALSSVCGKVAEKMWDARRFAQARKALQTACDSGDSLSCRQVQPLKEAGVESLQPSSASALPCGKFDSATGLINELDFGDRGIVTHSMSGKLRARLADGQVRIRHDKGGDFVLQPVGANRLIGLDTWNRFAVYTRKGKAPRCSAPVEYVERELPLDCPAAKESELKACCAAGKLQGCNAMGHRLALAGKWAEAKPYYQRVCREGVRAGCINLVKLTSEDEAAGRDVPALMKSLCKADPRHVACDVDETTHW